MNASKEHPLTVIGAGPAGVAAAVSAARAGARVLLLEASGRLGGAVTFCMHRALCGLYGPSPNSPLDTLNPGIQREVVELMLADAPATTRMRQMGKAWVLEFATDSWERALLRLCQQEAIDLRLNTRVTDVRCSQDAIKSIVCGQTVPVSALVDCTGGGHALQMIGADAMLPLDSHTPLAGYAVRLSGLSGDLELARLRVPHALSRCAHLPAEAKLTQFSPGPGADEGVCKFAADAEQNNWISDKRINEILSLLRESVEGFAEARVVEKSPCLFPRQGRRLLGQHVLAESDIVSAIAAGAVRAWWPMEYWEPQSGPQFVYPPAIYGIERGTLQSKVLGNLFAAGVSLSATAGAVASARAGGICLATGQLAGAVAAEIVTFSR